VLASFAARRKENVLYVRDHPTMKSLLFSSSYCGLAEYPSI
jgi:hypothetical protein